jgi:hypothetical protein
VRVGPVGSTLSLLVVAPAERPKTVLAELGLVRQRLEAVLEVLNERAAITDVARRYGAARQTVHGWLRPI